MKILEKITLILYSNIILILAVITCLLVFNWIDINVLQSVIEKGINSQGVANTLIIVSIVFILLSIKCIFFTSNSEDEKLKQGVLLQNENGKLMITQETLKSLVNSVVKGFESVELNSTDVGLDKENNVIVFVNLTVSSSVVIKELSTNLQAKIKETIKSMADLDVKEVNIRIKGVTQKVSE